MKKVKWDTEMGRLLWLDGQKDSEIADHFGIAVSTVTSYRKKHWEKTCTQLKLEADPAAREETEDVLEKEFDTVGPETSGTQKPVRFDTPANVYEILEAATKSLSGINAICTADAILCLWNWSTTDDLRRARAAINHILTKLEG